MYSLLHFIFDPLKLSSANYSPCVNNTIGAVKTVDPDRHRDALSCDATPPTSLLLLIPINRMTGRTIYLNNATFQIHGRGLDQPSCNYVTWFPSRDPVNFSVVLVSLIIIS